MGFNRRKMDDERREEADRQAAAKRALSPQVRADALRFVTECVTQGAVSQSDSKAACSKPRVRGVA
jgi:hypothetical protein